jgi:hypothetical protein
MLPPGVAPGWQLARTPAQQSIRYHSQRGLKLQAIPFPNSGVIAGSVPVESSDWGRMEQGTSSRDGDQGQAERIVAEAEPQRRGWWPFGRRQAPADTSVPAAAPDREEALEPGSPEEMQAAYLREAEQRQAPASRTLVTRNSRGPLRAPVRQQTQVEPSQ